MTNKEKAKELGQKYFPDENNIWARANIEAQNCKSACLEMAEWMADKACKAYCKQCDTKECEDFGSDTCNWLQKFKKILEN